MLAERVKEWPKQWKAEGREEGQREILSLLLEQKFGPLSAADEKRLKSASEKALNQAAARILTANSIDEVFSS